MDGRSHNGILGSIATWAAAVIGVLLILVLVLRGPIRPDALVGSGQASPTGILHEAVMESLRAGAHLPLIFRVK